MKSNLTTQDLLDIHIGLVQRIICLENMLKEGYKEDWIKTQLQRFQILRIKIEKQRQEMPH